MAKSDAGQNIPPMDPDNYENTPDDEDQTEKDDLTQTTEKKTSCEKPTQTNDKKKEPGRNPTKDTDDKKNFTLIIPLLIIQLETPRRKKNQLKAQIRIRNIARIRLYQ